MLGGLFEGWPNPPGPDTFLLRGASRVAVEVEDGQVVGFLYAISDGVLSAYIPLLTVRLERRGRGVAQALRTSLLAQLEGLNMIDTACDDDLMLFHERFGRRRGNAMIRRDYARQSGQP